MAAQQNLFDNIPKQALTSDQAKKPVKKITTKSAKSSLDTGKVSSTEVDMSMAAKSNISQKKVREELNKKANHRGRGRTEAEKREAYKAYRKRKRQAIEFEGRNKQYLILCPESDFGVDGKHFYIMGGTSAIIYAHDIGPRIKRKPTLSRDMSGGDEEVRFRGGVCRIEKLEILEKKLAEIGIKRDHRKGELVFFKLPREYASNEIKAMLKEEQKRMDNLNALIYPKVLYPDINRLIIDIKKRIPQKIKNMSPVYRTMFGEEMLRPLMNLIYTYTQMTHDDLDEKVAAEKMLIQSDMILSQISLMNELGLWDIKSSTHIVTQIVGMRQLIKGHIINKDKK